MKTIRFILFLLFCNVVGIGQSYAQNLVVESVAIAPNDNEARQKPRYDLNDSICALIKVSAPTLSGMKFGNSVIGEVTEVRSVYHVYIPQGTKRLRFQHQDYLSDEINFPDYGIRVKGGVTYEVSLSRPQLNNKSTVTTLFYVTPANAKLEVDGKAVRLEHDGLASMELDPGAHSYIVTARDYNSSEESFTVQKEEKTHLVNVELDKTMARVVFNCNVKNPHLIVDGVKYDNTSDLYLSVGDHSVRVYADGYKDYTSGVNVKFGAANIIKAKLKAQEMVVTLNLDNGCNTVDNKPTYSSVVSVTTGRHLFQQFAGKRRPKKSKIIKVVPDMNGHPISEYF